MKLYVWDDVLCDYTSGIMFAIAESEEDAKKIIMKNYDFVSLSDFNPNLLTIYDVTTEACRAVHGGG